MRSTSIRAAAVLAGALLLTAAACASPASEPTAPRVPLTLPAPTGPAPIGTLELHLVDHDRTDPFAATPDRLRELVVSIWYPARPGPDAPRAPYLAPEVADFYDRQAAALGVPSGTADFAGIGTHAAQRAPVADGATGLPVVLYSPGGNQSRALGTTLVEELASHGYVVVTIDHTYSGPVRFPDRTELAAPDLDKALIMQQRARDTGFVLDQLALVAAGSDPDAQHRGLPPGVAEALDLSRVGMFGHSAGGFTTAEAMLTEERIDAGANLDGSMPPEYGQAAPGGSSRPFLLVGGGTSGSDAHPHHHGAAPDWAAFWDASTGWKRDLHLPDAEHMSFTDLQVLLPQIDRAVPIADEALTGRIGTIDPARSLAVQRRSITAFFDEHLKGRTGAFDGAAAQDPDARLVP
ncbi:alpha/beta hydrolase family protein [Pseudonocardia kunmingensis]|nr:lipase [Pseudonocardia kunmingensis]